ncbi:plasmid partitioning protein RepB [Chelativorans sp. AA-79]|uniref:plasmid partitioning protein RepB n=1 Tax=Chelativorans sp. AA-79 TaxID=3028735 RepID=UPI0023F66642|nr:plasmid partitioning protein RepB [Chelativorans sp. AA-79]WEX12435.1 plasmid partitioning protein RepB [Chelativorans sp. AA-79]
MSRKDSKGMFTAVLSQINDDDQGVADSASVKSKSPHLLKVAAGVRQMQERSEIADKLLREGDHTVELDPDTILPSLIPDRFDSAYDDAAVSDIVESMRVRGQIVPGLVRPVSNDIGSFQIVYGRRRLAAAKILGIKFRAAVRELTDEEAVIFQGEENTSREDLSFIEKCLFAVAQQEAGYKRETICASLSTGKSHVSEMIKIGTSIPKDILHAIGKAPSIGRNRWEDFLQLYGIDSSTQIVADTIRKRSFLDASSDDRFNTLLAAMKTDMGARKPVTGQARNSQAWVPQDRSVSVRLKDNGKSATLAIGNADGPKFAAFIAERLDDLYEAFRKDVSEQ